MDAKQYAKRSSAHAHFYYLVAGLSNRQPTASTEGNSRRSDHRPARAVATEINTNALALKERYFISAGNCCEWFGRVLPGEKFVDQFPAESEVAAHPVSKHL